MRGLAADPLRKITLLATLHDIDIHARWIPTHEIALAGLLSRRNLTSSLFPLFAQEPSPQEPSLDPPESWYTDIGLPRIAARYLWWGLSSNTRRTYDTARRSYVICYVSRLRPSYPITQSSAAGRGVVEWCRCR